jgi:hypothetical protein
MKQNPRHKKSVALVERFGVNAVEGLFVNQFGWIFREQHVSDWGVDAHVEIIQDGVPSGKLFALQIKAGASYFRKNGVGYTFRGVLRHLQYWENHSLPVLIVLVHPETGTAFCQIASRRLAKISPKSWSVEVPPENQLTAHLRPFLKAALWSKAHSLDVPYRRFLLHIEAFAQPREFLSESMAQKRNNLPHEFAHQMFELLIEQITSDLDLIKYLLKSKEVDFEVVRTGRAHEIQHGKIAIQVLPFIEVVGGYVETFIVDEVDPYTRATRGFLELLKCLVANKELVQTRHVILLPEGFRHRWESYPDGGGVEEFEIESILKRLNRMGQA